jgi:predicted outer membrane repeat protein
MTRLLKRIPSRRDVLRGLVGAGLGLGFVGLADPAEAKKKHKRKKKKKKKCKGVTKKCGKKCIPQDECYGGCPGNALCDGGVCHPCTVTCVSGIPTVCGADLQVALAAGGTVYVCPGRYQENFTLDAAVRVLGAGEGAGVATDTILTANGFGRVLQINNDVGTVELERLRITGGSADNGGGISHEGTTLRLTDCTVSGNTAGAGGGGGIYAGLDTILELTNCTVRDNEAIAAGGDGGGLSLIFATATLSGSTQVRGNAAQVGGGIFYAGTPTTTLVIAETCRVEENTDTNGSGSGGGIYSSLGAVTLQGADPSPIVVNNCAENCAGDGVPKCSTAPPISC